MDVKVDGTSCRLDDALCFKQLGSARLDKIYRDNDEFRLLYTTRILTTVFSGENDVNGLADSRVLLHGTRKV